MVKRIIGAILVFRLEMRQFPLDLEQVWHLWRQRPAIEIVVATRARISEQRALWRQRLNEVYPF